MIHPQCFTKEWLKRQAEAIGSRNPVMLEKAIVAIQLFGRLAESGLPIQFKGGTSLLLRLNPIRRLSIDVDIVTQAQPEELLIALARVSTLAPLTGYEHDAQSVNSGFTRRNEIEFRTKDTKRRPTLPQFCRPTGACS